AVPFHDAAHKREQVAVDSVNHDGIAGREVPSVSVDLAVALALDLRASLMIEPDCDTHAPSLAMVGAAAATRPPPPNRFDLVDAPGGRPAIRRRVPTHILLRVHGGDDV